MKKIRDCPFVIVEWLDSGEYEGWHYFDTFKPTPIVHATTVGWIVHEDDDGLTVAASLADYQEDRENFHFCGAMHIPKRAIIREYHAQDAAAALWPPEDKPDNPEKGKST